MKNICDAFVLSSCETCLTIDRPRPSDPGRSRCHHLTGCLCIESYWTDIDNTGSYSALVAVDAYLDINYVDLNSAYRYSGRHTRTSTTNKRHRTVDIRADCAFDTRTLHHACIARKQNTYVTCGTARRTGGVLGGGA